jgi:hypothetical protein
MVTARRTGCSTPTWRLGRTRTGPERTTPENGCTAAVGACSKASLARQTQLTVSKGGTGIAVTFASGSNSARRWRTSAKARSLFTRALTNAEGGEVVTERTRSSCECRQRRQCEYAAGTRRHRGQRIQPSRARRATHSGSPRHPLRPGLRRRERDREGLRQATLSRPTWPTAPLSTSTSPGHVRNEPGYRKADYVLSGCVTRPGRAD